MSAPVPPAGARGAPAAQQPVASRSLSAAVATNRQSIEDLNASLAELKLISSVAGRRRRLDQEVPDVLTLTPYGTTVAPTPRRPPPAVPSAEGGVRNLASIVASPLGFTVPPGAVSASAGLDRTAPLRLAESLYARQFAAALPEPAPPAPATPPAPPPPPPAAPAGPEPHILGASVRKPSRGGPFDVTAVPARRRPPVNTAASAGAATPAPSSPPSSSSTAGSGALMAPATPLPSSGGGSALAFGSPFAAAPAAVAAVGTQKKPVSAREWAAARAAQQPQAAAAGGGAPSYYAPPPSAAVVPPFSATKERYVAVPATPLRETLAAQAAQGRQLAFTAAPAPAAAAAVTPERASGSAASNPGAAAGSSSLSALLSTAHKLHRSQQQAAEEEAARAAVQAAAAKAAADAAARAAAERAAAETQVQRQSASDAATAAVLDSAPDRESRQALAAIMREAALAKEALGGGSDDDGAGKGPSAGAVRTPQPDGGADAAAAAVSEKRAAAARASAGGGSTRNLGLGGVGADGFIHDEDDAASQQHPNEPPPQPADGSDPSAAAASQRRGSGAQPLYVGTHDDEGGYAEEEEEEDDAAAAAAAAATDPHARLADTIASLQSSVSSVQRWLAVRTAGTEVPITEPLMQPDGILRTPMGALVLPPTPLEVYAASASGATVAGGSSFAATGAAPYPSDDPYAAYHRSRAGIEMAKAAAYVERVAAQAPVRQPAVRRPRLAHAAVAGAAPAARPPPTPQHQQPQPPQQQQQQQQPQQQPAAPPMVPALPLGALAAAASGTPLHGVGSRQPTARSAARLKLASNYDDLDSEAHSPGGGTGSGSAGTTATPLPAAEPSEGLMLDEDAAEQQHHHEVEAAAPTVPRSRSRRPSQLQKQLLSRLTPLLNLPQRWLPGGQPSSPTSGGGGGGANGGGGPTGLPANKLAAVLAADGEPTLAGPGDPSDLIFKGLLLKADPTGRRWKLRYAALTPACLLYYASRGRCEDDLRSGLRMRLKTGEKGEVDFGAGGGVVTLGIGPGKLRSRGHPPPTPWVFRLDMPPPPAPPPLVAGVPVAAPAGRSYLFAAGSPDALMSWVGALATVTHAHLGDVLASGVASGDLDDGLARSVLASAAEALQQEQQQQHPEGGGGGGDDAGSDHLVGSTPGGTARGGPPR